VLAIDGLRLHVRPLLPDATSLPPSPARGEPIASRDCA